VPLLEWNGPLFHVILSRPPKHLAFPPEIQPIDEISQDPSGRFPTTLRRTNIPRLARIRKFSPGESFALTELSGQRFESFSMRP